MNVQSFVYSIHRKQPQWGRSKILKNQYAVKLINDKLFTPYNSLLE